MSREYYDLTDGEMKLVLTALLISQLAAKHTDLKGQIGLLYDRLKAEYQAASATQFELLP